MLLNVEQKLLQHEQVISETKAKITTLQDAISRMDTAAADSQGLLRNYRDNQRLRAANREVESLTNEIEELDETGSRKAHRTFETNYTQMREKQSTLQALQAKTGGELEMLKSDVESKKEELKAEYDDIDNRYRTELIKVKVSSAAHSV